jgi:hypothetical protein
MRKSLSGKTPGLSVDQGPDRKKIKNIAIGTVLGVVVLLVIAIAALTVLNPGSSPSATPTPTPAPSATPAASVTPAPTPAPTPVPTEKPAQTGWVYSNTDQLQLSGLLKADSGMLIVGITITPGSAPVNVSNLTVNIVCDGQTYDRVYTIGAKEWDLWDGTTMLRVGVNIAAKIDTIKAGIPQGRPMTVKITRNGDPYGQFTLAPTP